MATVSSGDETIGKLIAEAMEKVSHDGVITVEESKTAEDLQLKSWKACSLTAAMLPPYMVTDTDKMEAVHG